MTQTNILNAADYADALLTARRAKNTAFLVILLLLVAELGLFFTARYTTILNTTADTRASALRGVLQWVIGLIDFLGLICPALLAAILFIILNVLLVGRLLGAGRLTGAFIASVLLALLLFPWQSFLNNPTMNNDPALNAMGLKLPGCLYTWAELTHVDPVYHKDFGATFHTDDMKFAILRWFRFVGFPAVCIVLLFAVQMKSDRGLRQALGSETVVTQTTATTTTPI
jgi:hypothetical protein